MKFSVFSILFLTASSILASEAYRILGIFPYNGKSHFVMTEALMKGLANRGHQVDVVGHFPLKKPHPNYTDIISLAGTWPDLVNNMTFDFMTSEAITSPIHFIGENNGNKGCNEFLQHPKMQEIIKNPPKDPPYDLVITEIFGADCFIAFGHHLKVPVVAISTNVLYPWYNDPFGNPDNPSYIPNTFLGFVGHMNFWERLQNTVSVIIEKIQFTRVVSVQDEMIRRHIGPDLPGIERLKNEVALVLVNSHYSLNTARPLTPGVIEVGGLHIQNDDSVLTSELKKWLDESKDGFVYFTFGSMVKIESFPKQILSAIYASLAKLKPVRVLMKAARKDELPPGLPDNVLTQPWIPQMKVLGHKNVRAFITHGGLLGTQEAVHAGVPLIGIPLFADQELNIKTYMSKKMAVSVRLADLSEETLDAALDAVLKNSTYREAAEKVSAQFRDRPLSAMDTAIFWVEYVIRNGGSALRSPALDLTWWQLALLDVYLTLLFAVLLVIYLAAIIAKKLIQIVFYATGTKASTTKKLK